MRKLTTALSVLAISAFAFGASASASQRVDSHSLTDVQAKQLVQENGSVLLSTGPDLYDRYVANGAYCFFGEQPEPAYVPTANSSSAFVGYTCAPDFDQN
ncbi:hypothetical protein [Cohaesibacter haloalkalitolerans]|uniref:hypothetical protein n=1 Tax=Cohaesibacter haloalkalitolerans TaxID=1162980 RepID=UPI000E65C050|nr:hypothetical protein [Cohaesibacter haloalkalitolerans]